MSRILRSVARTGLVLTVLCPGMSTVAETVLGIDPTIAVLGGAAFALLYALLAGFWGVVITDVVQFCLAMAGSIILAVIAVDRIGGIAELKARLAASPLVSADTTAFIPGGGFGLESNFFKFLGHFAGVFRLELHSNPSPSTTSFTSSPLGPGFANVFGAAAMSRFFTFANSASPARFFHSFGSRLTS